MGDGDCYVNYANTSLLGKLSRLYLIAGLDCGLDYWTGLLDWITGMTFEPKLCTPHDLHLVARLP